MSSIDTTAGLETARRFLENGEEYFLRNNKIFSDRRCTNVVVDIRYLGVNIQHLLQEFNIHTNHNPPQHDQDIERLYNHAGRPPC